MFCTLIQWFEPNLANGCLCVFSHSFGVLSSKSSLSKAIQEARGSYAGSSDPTLLAPWGNLLKLLFYLVQKFQFFLSGKSNLLKLHVRSYVLGFLGWHTVTTRTETLELRSFWKKKETCYFTCCLSHLNVIHMYVCLKFSFLLFLLYLLE